MDDKITSDIREKAIRVCAEYIGGAWEQLLPEEILLDHLPQSLSNLIFRCSLPENIQSHRNEPRQVILRIFLNIIHQTELSKMRENLIFALLAQKGLAPQLYGIFEDGRVEEFIPSRNLEPKDLHNTLILEALARNLAQFHLFTAPISKNQNLLTNRIDMWLKDIYTNPKYHEGNDKERQDKLDKLLSLPFREEAKWIQTMSKLIKSPVVFCHNDLQVNNILLKESPLGLDDTNLQLIDFEFSRYGYRGNDFASAYCSFCIDYFYPEPPYFKADWNQFPSVEEQTRFIRTYISEQKKHTNISLDIKEEVKKLLEEPKFFVLFQHYIISLHGIWRYDKTSFKFDWLAYSLMRFDIYLKHKKLYFGES